MHLLSAKAKPPHLIEDFVRGLGPLEGLAVLVVRIDVRKDGLAELRDARVRSALERLLGEQPKESLDEVQPRGIGRREMKVDPRMTQHPSVHRGRFVSREV